MRETKKDEIKNIMECLQVLNKTKHSREYIDAINTIANLMIEASDRETKGTYNRKFNLYKLTIDIKFNWPLINS